MTTKAIILAAGRGTRMRRADVDVPLGEQQERVAEHGMKAIMPIGNRPFLDYVISGLADAGIRDVCVVIGASAEHERVRQYYEHLRVGRVRLSFTVQCQPRGTADALLSAESFANGEHLLSINADNYYPVATLRALRELSAAGVSVFERRVLIERSNIPPERVAQFAVVTIDRDGMLERIIEKPDAQTLAALGEPVYVSMNSWSLPPEIYDACRRIEPSPRGELELQDAVQLARDEMGVAFHALICRDGVLDLSTRADIAAVAERLADVEVRL
jgi:glucose-1-phosphate thymidylyltransferase